MKIIDIKVFSFSAWYAGHRGNKCKQLFLLNLIKKLIFQFIQIVLSSADVLKLKNHNNHL